MATPPPSSATPIATLPAGWESYHDPQLGFSFPRPVALTLAEDSYTLPEKSGNLAAVEGRTLVFSTASGVPAIALSVAPNPRDLSIEEWVNSYTGWSGEPREITIGGERAVIDPKDQVNNPVPQIYFGHSGYFFTLQLNVAGIPESGLPAALSQQDMDRIVQGFAFQS
jgi:hypothetical protein